MLIVVVVEKLILIYYILTLSAIASVVNIVMHMHINEFGLHLIHSRIRASQSNRTVNYCFTSDLHRHNIVIRVVHMHVDGCSSRGVYNHIIF